MTICSRGSSRNLEQSRICSAIQLFTRFNLFNSELKRICSPYIIALYKSTVTYLLTYIGVNLLKMLVGSDCPPFLVSSPPLTSHPFPSPLLRSGAQVQLRVMGSAVSVSSPSGVWGGAPAEIKIWCILALKYELWWQ